MNSFEYTDGETVFEGYLSGNHQGGSKLPCILVAHAWDGPNEHLIKLQMYSPTKALWDSLLMSTEKVYEEESTATTVIS